MAQGPTQKKVTFSPHALTTLSSRGIEREWAERTLFDPDWTATDPLADRMRMFKAIPERNGRILRVVYAESPSEIRVITVFFDRNAKKP